MMAMRQSTSTKRDTENCQWQSDRYLSESRFYGMAPVQILTTDKARTCVCGGITNSSTFSSEPLEEIQRETRRNKPKNGQPSPSPYHSNSRTTEMRAMQARLSIAALLRGLYQLRSSVSHPLMAFEPTISSTHRYQHHHHSLYTSRIWAR